METADTASQNDLSTEMTDEELDAFVDKTLGLKPAKTVEKEESKDDKKDDSKSDKDQKNKESSDEDQEEESVAAPAPTKKQEKEDDNDQEAADIADVDTSDLWIEIEGLVTDLDGNNHEKKFKISLEEGIPDDVKFKSDKQLYEVLDAMNEMRQIRTERIADHDKAVEDRDNTTKEEANQKSVLDGWDAEIEQLIEDGLLEQPKAKPGDKDYMNDPSVQTMDEVFKFMTKENETRIKDGKKPIRSFAVAFNKFTKQQKSAEDAEKEKKEADLTKKRGALVGGGSGTGGSGKKDDFVYKAGSAKSIWSVKTDDL